MLSRIALLLLGFCVARQAVAGDSLSPSAYCRQQIAAGRAIWAQGGIDTPPANAALMVDAIDGKLPQVRQQLLRMSPADAARWRQAAMIAATYAQRATEVDALLDDGATVDGVAWTPPYSRRFHRKVVAGMEQDTRFGGPAGVKNLTAAGLLKNEGQRVGPALVIASQCGDAATVDVLLRHHANVAAREAPNVVDALDIAVIHGDADIVQRLLDHGANACMHDRLARQRMLTAKRQFTPLADIGRRSGLPDGLIARLACPAMASVR